MNTLSCFEDFKDPFFQSIEDCLSGEEVLSDFESLCYLRLQDISNTEGMPIAFVYPEEEDDDNHELTRVFSKLHLKNRYKVIKLIERHGELILDEILNDVNDREFRDIWPKIDLVIKICWKTIDRICNRVIENSKVEIPWMPKK